MANKPKLGRDAVPVPPRHGQQDHVVLRIDIPQDLKDDLVFHAENVDRTLKSVVMQALKEYLNKSA